jgi:hypothetical protein
MAETMRWDIRVEENRSRLTVSASGDPEIEGFKSYLEAALSHPAWRPGMPVLCDFRQLNIQKVTTNDIIRIVLVHKQYRERTGDNPIAVVVSRQIDFGMVRIWESYSEALFSSQNVFYTVEEAGNWLINGDAREFGPE